MFTNSSQASTKVKSRLANTASPPIQGMPELWSFIDTKSVQEESTSNQKPMRPLALISAASLLLLAAFWLSPQAAKAQWQGVNEKKWVESIETNIRNKAFAQDICINSTDFATISKEIAFKDWALSIAQKYCAVEGATTAATAPIDNKDGQCQLDSSDVYKISVGEKIHKRDRGCWSSFN